MNIRIFILIFEILIIRNKTYSQDEAIKKETKSAIENIFNLVNESDSVQLCKYIVFHFRDDSIRLWKDHLNFENPRELKSSRKTLEYIKKGYLNCKSYNYLEFFSQMQRDGKYTHAWRMEFIYPEKKDEAIFAVRKIKGHYVLVDID